MVSTTLTPSARSFRMSSQVARRACGSMPAVGSSRKTSSGRPTSASASDSRCCCPPDSRLTAVPATSAQADECRAGRRGRAVRRRRRRTGAAVRGPWRRCSRRRRPAASRPTRGRSAAVVAAGSRPSTRTARSRRRRKPSQISIVVVLPAPFGPSSASTVPRSTVSDSPSTARRGAVGLDEVDDLDGRTRRVDTRQSRNGAPRGRAGAAGRQRPSRLRGQTSPAGAGEGVDVLLAATAPGRPRGPSR